MAGNYLLFCLLERGCHRVAFITGQSAHLCCSCQRKRTPCTLEVLLRLLGMYLTTQSHRRTERLCSSFPVYICQLTPTRTYSLPVYTKKATKKICYLKSPLFFPLFKPPVSDLTLIISLCEISGS